MIHRAMALFMGLLLIFHHCLAARPAAESTEATAGDGPRGDRPGFYPAHPHQRT